ncbi:DUF4142 domain-containing protein [Dyadobacter sp. CY323]|uniref:DUF4142 domain-containing protein n=1 Tax=Dyadobacter sp. CY323 TaxID=2907302 RepID=UPI001F4792CA|nr:DUF4142 domain-containing protein [Dyadobacter sp. CY323]MCE6992953.1 DUF4142 domain-containing protein [Dyadobacter sp. CY323]
MKKLLLPFGFACILFTASSCTDHEVDGMLSRTDRDFMIKAADSNLFEIKAGEMATGKAVVDSVRHYGEHMVTDHSKATAEMMALAHKKMLDLPEMLSMDKQKKLDSLAMMNGMAFDSLYMTMMVKSHIETIDLFQTETTLGDDPEVKSFAAGKLPTLHHHLEEAIELKEWLW